MFLKDLFLIIVISINALHYSALIALMTEVATINFGVEDTVLNALGSSQHTLHLLWLHLLEGFDKLNLQVLSSIKKAANQQLILRISILLCNPFLAVKLY